MSVAAEMAQAAGAWLRSLSADQRAQAPAAWAISAATLMG